MFDLQKLKRLKENYINAEGIYSTMKNIEKTIHKKILDENKYKYKSQENRNKYGLYIKNINHTYLMQTKDYQDFIKKSHSIWLQYFPDHQSGETLWEYEIPYYEAEKEISDYIIETLKKDEITYINMDMIKTMHQRKELIEITLETFI